MVIVSGSEKMAEVTAGVKWSFNVSGADVKANLFTSLALGTVTSVSLSFTGIDPALDAGVEYPIGQANIVLSASAKAFNAITIPYGIKQVFITATPTGDDTTTPANLKIGVTSSH